MKKKTFLIIILSFIICILTGCAKSTTTSFLTTQTDNTSQTTTTTKVKTYYSDFDYDDVITKTKSEIKTIVYDLISVCNINYTYTETRDLFNQTDLNPKTNKVVLLYSKVEINAFETQSKNYNREHVWPQSLGEKKDDQGGHDLHHIRPVLEVTNSERDNKLYGNVDHNATTTKKYNGQIYGYSTSAYFEPVDSVKGDVARICFYYSIMYGYSLDIITGSGNSSVLLEWNELDPVDDIERYRNEAIYKIQGNKNIFIDYPELADYIF